MVPKVKQLADNKCVCIKSWFLANLKKEKNAGVWATKVVENEMNEFAELQILLFRRSTAALAYSE